VDRHKALPLYAKVAETIKGRIRSNHYVPGDMIPPARELAEEFGVSNITIRKAIEVLTREGFLAPRQGVGTMVAGSGRDVVEIEITGNFREWLDSASGVRLRVTTEVLDMADVRPPERVRLLMGLPSGEHVRRIKRRRRYKDRIISYFINYFPSGISGNIRTESLARKSFIEVFQETCGIRLTRMEQRVEAGMADMELSDLLGTDFGAPLFFIENTYYAGGPGPVIVSHMYYRGDSYVYKALIPLNESKTPRR
jgi:GntR family transcriptional regulator